MEIQPYLFFDGRCEEALEFYRRVLGAEVTLMMRYRESPDPGGMPAGAAEKVMHANLRIGASTLLASDGMCREKPDFRGFSLSLTVADKAEAERLFAALVEGGEVRMPLAPTFFSPAFGMLTDRFGVGWMVYVAS